MTDTSSNSFAINYVSAVGPTYISSLQPYQSRSLSGAYAPTGVATHRALFAATEYGTDDDIVSFSGGFKRNGGTFLDYGGGGHVASHSNAIVRFDFAGTTRPAGFSFYYYGSAAENASGSTPNPDGTPGAYHTYDGQCQVGASLFRTGAYTYNSNGANRLHEYTGSAWIDRGGFGAMGPTMAIADPNSGQIILMDRFFTNFTYCVYNTNTHVMGPQQSNPGSSQWPNDSITAYRPNTDPTTGTILCSGGGNFNGGLSMQLAVDWTRTSGQITSITNRNLGAVSSAGGAGVFYDSLTDRFWGFTRQNPISTIYEINPSTWVVTPHTLSGDTISVTDVQDGIPLPIYSRFHFMPQYRAVGLVVGRTTPAYVIRLPATV